MRKKIKIQIKSTKHYLTVLNGLFSLTDKEITILGKFIDKHNQFKKDNIDVFSTEVKKSIADELNIDDPYTLNVYIKRLKDKNAIRKTSKYEIHPLLLRGEEEEAVEFIWKT
jgi:hypothetical protein